jgi:hypothetical protein
VCAKSYPFDFCWPCYNSYDELRPCRLPVISAGASVSICSSIVNVLFCEAMPPSLSFTETNVVEEKYLKFFSYLEKK